MRSPLAAEAGADGATRRGAAGPGVPRAACNLGTPWLPMSSSTWGRHGRAMCQPSLMKCCNLGSKMLEPALLGVAMGCATHRDFCWIRRRQMLQPVARGATASREGCYNRVLFLLQPIPEFLLLRFFVVSMLFFAGSGQFFCSNGLMEFVF